MTKPFPSSMFSLTPPKFGASTSVFARLFIWRRHRIERERMAKIYNELITHADEHILNDLGITRDDLFRFRAKLYE